jgi:hypothetical protein
MNAKSEASACGRRKVGAMKTVTEYVAEQQAAFRRLSRGRQGAIRRQAAQYIREYPHMADVSTFWRGLSARQIP